MSEFSLTTFKAINTHSTKHSVIYQINSFCTFLLYQPLFTNSAMPIFSHLNVVDVKLCLTIIGHSQSLPTMWQLLCSVMASMGFNLVVIPGSLTAQLLPLGKKSLDQEFEV